MAGGDSKFFISTYTIFGDYYLDDVINHGFISKALNHTEYFLVRQKSYLDYLSFTISDMGKYTEIIFVREIACVQWVFIACPSLGGITVRCVWRVRQADMTPRVVNTSLSNH